jgi:hypothetical protein
MKGTLIIICLLFSIFTFGQEKNDTIKVIAKLITPGQGSKIHIAKYEIIKVIKGQVTNDTIEAGYYFYKENKNKPDTVLLNLTTYTGDTKTKDYYIFPDYDAEQGIENIKLIHVSFDYWEGCETGKGECLPLTISRKTINDNCFLIMPCGGTATTVTLSEKQGIPKGSDIIQTEVLSVLECPPIFVLTNLKDGKYYAYMLACGLGGQIEINLKTKNE